MEGSYGTHEISVAVPPRVDGLLDAHARKARDPVAEVRADREAPELERIPDPGERHVGAIQLTGGSGNPFHAFTIAREVGRHADLRRDARAERVHARRSPVDAAHE